MEQLYNELVELSEKLPAYNSDYANKELSDVLNKYSRILDIVHNTNEDLKRNTSLYFGEISSIEASITNCKWAKTQKARDTAFLSARNGLESDIKALANLISRNIS